MLRLHKLQPVASAGPSAIRESIQEHCQDEDILSILLKDCHLVEAALATDCRVASLDERARGHFATLAAAIEALRVIVWVNPATAREHAME
jgi:hypothetical protein